MTSQLWQERVAGTLRKLPKRAAVACSRRSGIELAIQRRISPSIPQVTVWSIKDSTVETISDIFTDAVGAAVGSKVIGRGVPYSQGLEILLDYQRVVGPIDLVVGWVSDCREFAAHCANYVSPESSLLFVDEEPLDERVFEGFQQFDGRFLELNYSEALRECRGVISDTELQAILSEAQGSYPAFKQSFLRHLDRSNSSVKYGDGRFWSEGVSIDGLIDALVSRTKWDDAFELACSHAPERLLEFLDEAGNFYVDRGAFDYLWMRLSSLPPDLKRLEKVAYWLTATGLATNRSRGQTKQAEALLGQAEAPELRATTAVVIPTDSMLAETSRAVESLRSPATLRAHGFALAWAGDRAQPVPLFREAMRLAERDAAHHLVVACGIDIAEVEIRQGRYRSGAEWAQWALDEYQRRGLNETLRRSSAIATLGFARMLLGDTPYAEDELSKIEVSEAYSEVPGYEAVISTIGNLAFLRSDYDLALDYYQRNHQKAPLEAYCFTALDLLSVYVATGNWSEAERLANTALAIGKSSTAYEKALGELIAGIAFSRTDPSRAEQHLVAAIEGLTCTTADVHVAQAALWLAIVRLKLNRKNLAVKALQLGTLGLRELGDDGWKLLGMGAEGVQEVQKLWAQTEFDYELRLLGARQLRSGCSVTDLSLRGAELLAILAIYPEGVSAERLHALTYGDTSFRSTVKVNISRLRTLVPIGSNPYRLEGTVRTDFVKILELISTGELQKALNLYHGPLLPESESPLIREWREHIDESLRMAVIETRDPDLLIQYGTLLDDDLDIWELAKSSMPASDYRRPVVNARIRRIKASWSRD